MGEQKNNLDILQGFINQIDPTLPLEAQLAEEQAAGELLAELRESEALAVARGALFKRARARHPSFPALAESLPTSPQELIGIPCSKLVEGGEKLLDGRSPAMVVRAGQYKNFEEDILAPLQRLGDFRLLGEENFPKAGNGLGHSRMHLDNFVNPDGSHFRYSLTASKVTKGKVVFIAGLASQSVRTFNETQYKSAEKSLNESPPIVGLEERATERINPRGVGYSEWNQASKGVRGELIAVTLSEGDVAVWPQGGPGAKLPAWHGFIQVGHPQAPNFEPRQSVSYHLGQ